MSALADVENGDRSGFYSSRFSRRLSAYPWPRSLIILVLLLFIYFGFDDDFGTWSASKHLTHFRSAAEAGARVVFTPSPCPACPQTSTPYVQLDNAIGTTDCPVCPICEDGTDVYDMDIECPVCEDTADKGACPKPEPCPTCPQPSSLAASSCPDPAPCPEKACPEASCPKPEPCPKCPKPSSLEASSCPDPAPCPTVDSQGGAEGQQQPWTCPELFCKSQDALQPLECPDPPTLPCVSRGGVEVVARTAQAEYGSYEVSVDDIQQGRALPLDVLQRSLLSGSNPRLRRFVRKLMAGQPVKVQITGGSISVGSGCWGRGCPGRAAKEGLNLGMAALNDMICGLNEGCNSAFMWHLMIWINKTWPHPEHMMVNNARGAGTTHQPVDCFDSMFLPDADLVVIEYDVNELDQVSVEMLTRKVLDLPSRPAVIELATYHWGREKGGERINDRYTFYINETLGLLAPGDSSQARLLATGLKDEDHALEHFSLSKYYQTSVASVHAALLPEVMRKEPGFVPVSGWCSDGIHPRIGPAITRDKNGTAVTVPHMPGVYGAWMGHMLINVIRSTWSGLPGQPAPAALPYHDPWVDEERAGAPLPPRVLGDGTHGEGVRCYFWNPHMHADPVVHKNDTAPHWSRSPEDDYKPGIIAREIGAVIDIVVDATHGTEDDSANPQGKAKQMMLKVEYLYSWLPNMEAATAQCVDGCECEDPASGTPILTMDGRRTKEKVSTNTDGYLKITKSTAKCILRFTTVPSDAAPMQVQEDAGEKSEDEQRKARLAHGRVFKILSLHVVRQYNDV